MPLIKFPLKKPVSGHPAPYTIEFDFLPNPLVSEVPPDQAPYLYTTFIRIDDTDPESSRIQHVFPSGKVFFALDETIHPGFLANISQVTDAIFSNSLTTTIRGTWLHAARPNVLKTLRTSSVIETPFIPSVVCYDSVLLSPAFFQQLKSFIQSQSFKIAGDEDHVLEPNSPINQGIIIGEWLKGNLGIMFSDEAIASGTITLPMCHDRKLQLGGLMLDGNGIEYSSAVNLARLIRMNKVANRLFDPDNHINSLMIIPCPMNTFFVVAENANDNHPYRRLIDITNPEVIIRHIWDAAVFYTGQPVLVSASQFHPTGYTMLEARVGADYQVPINRHGILFYPDLTGKELRVIDKGSNSDISDDVEANLYIMTASQKKTGTPLVLSESDKRNHYYSIGMGIPPRMPPFDENNPYFGIAPSMDNVMTFFGTLEKLHQLTLTTAGVFALSMGFLAESIASYFVSDAGRLIVQVAAGNLQTLDGDQTAKIFLATCYELYFTEKYRYPLASRKALASISGNYRSIIDSITQRWPSEDSWLKTHEDHFDNHPMWGWKNFGLNPDGGHKHHFLHNAISANQVSIIASFVGNMQEILPTNIGGEGEPIDEQYNERGREFGYWCMFSYSPKRVYGKVKELLVENETIN